jgi:integrase
MAKRNAKEPDKTNTDAQKYKYERVSFRHDGKLYAAYGQTKAEAHKKAAKMQLAFEKGKIEMNGNMTVRVWAKEWLETYKKSVVIDKVYQDYEHRINDFIVPAIGNVKLKDVKDIQLQKILNARAGYSTSHVSKLRYTVKAIFRQARISRLIIYDPAEGLKMPKTTAGSYRSITDEERKYILAAAEKHPAGLWVKTMLYCGLRPGETMALAWRNIDFKKNRINVDAAVEAGSNNIKLPKTSAGVRSVPAPKALLNELKANKGEPFEPVFTQQKSAKWHTHQSIRCLWHSFKKAVDIEMGAKIKHRAVVRNGHTRRIKDEVLSVVDPDLQPYCLRHTYGTDLQDAGVAINIAKYLMGHADIATTGNIYTDTTERAIIDAAEKHAKLIESRGR